MKLSLADAAHLMGKTQRQVRYLIQQGRLKAGKANGRWQIDSEDLPLTAGQRQAAAARGEQLRHEVEQALAPATTASKKAGHVHFSVRRLRAFQAGEPLFRDLVACIGPEASATRCLRESLPARSRRPQGRASGRALFRQQEEGWPGFDEALRQAVRPCGRCDQPLGGLARLPPGQAGPGQRARLRGRRRPPCAGVAPPAGAG